jgi:hypothetical protein
MAKSDLLWYKTCGVYLLGEKERSPTAPLKIGRALNPEGRFIGLQAGTWRQLELVQVWTVPGYEFACRVETVVLRHFDRVRPKSEWIYGGHAAIADFVEQAIAEFSARKAA